MGSADPAPAAQSATAGHRPSQRSWSSGPVPTPAPGARVGRRLDGAARVVSSPTPSWRATGPGRPQPPSRRATPVWPREALSIAAVHPPAKEGTARPWRLFVWPRRALRRHLARYARRTAHSGDLPRPVGALRRASRADPLRPDEINRTPPKTQAALLEAMQEKPGHGRPRVQARRRSARSSAPPAARSRSRRAVLRARHPEPDRAGRAPTRCPRPSSTASTVSSTRSTPAAPSAPVSPA